MKRFQKSGKKSYAFIVKSGAKFKESVYKLCTRMINNETFPKKFDNTVLNQIWKQKGDKAVLKNNRYIHTKD